jgi:LPS sulfotransferase NodH
MRDAERPRPGFRRRAAQRPTLGHQRVICIVAGQRAGTTALQKALATTQTVSNYGEIFQTKENSAPARSQRGSFVEFARAQKLSLADAMTAEGAEDIAGRYFDFLKEDASPNHVVVDVKLNSWFALSPAWAYPHDEPFLMKFLKRLDTVFIFVWRKSLADQVLSGFISRQFGIWHNLDGDKVVGRRFEVPIGRLKKTATALCQAEQTMYGHLADYPSKIMVAYEELYRDGALSDKFVASFEQMSQIGLGNARAGGIRPNAVSKRDIITNYDEAVETIEGIAQRYRRADWPPGSS